MEWALLQQRQQMQHQHQLRLQQQGHHPGNGRLRPPPQVGPGYAPPYSGAQAEYYPLKPHAPPATSSPSTFDVSSFDGDLESGLDVDVALALAMQTPVAPFSDPSPGYHPQSSSLDGLHATHAYAAAPSQVSPHHNWQGQGHLSATSVPLQALQNPVQHLQALQDPFDSFLGYPSLQAGLPIPVD